MAAAFNPNPDVMRLLIDSNVEIHARTRDGWTAVMYADAYNENPLVAQALLDAGAHLDVSSEPDAPEALTDVDCTDSVAVRDQTNAGLVSDCEALLNARDALDGGAGVLDWNTGTRIRYWKGISVRLGRVVGLDLAESGIRGRIPAVLGALTELEDLDLGHNELTGNHPA